MNLVILKCSLLKNLVCFFNGEKQILLFAQDDNRENMVNETKNAHFEYVLHLGDNALILGQRLSEWCGHGPVLEEDIALANIALDLIGQSRLLLSHAALLEGQGRDEDALAYLREANQFMNFTLLELPNGDFAFTIVRNVLFSAYQCQLWQELSQSRDTELAAIAAKSIKESRYHLRHSGEWLIRLGDGTEDSHRRAQAAMDELWPYSAEMFVDLSNDNELVSAGVAIAPASLEAPWREEVASWLTDAMLSAPAATRFTSGGRRGVHSEHFGFLLAEMQVLHRAHPGAKW